MKFNTIIEVPEFTLELNELDDYILDIVKEFANNHFIQCYRAKARANTAKNIQQYNYYSKVTQLTEMNLHNVEGIEKRGKLFALDHIIPVSFGF